MNPEVKEKWLAALKSGEYVRGRGYLKSKKEEKVVHCCLGVLCEIYIQETGSGEWEPDHYGGCFSFKLGDPTPDRRNSSVATLTKDMQVWSGIDTTVGLFPFDKKTDSGIVSLAAANDRSVKEDFSDVIPYIEQYF